jgi:hypothetical protein
LAFVEFADAGFEFIAMVFVDLDGGADSTEQRDGELAAEVFTELVEAIEQDEFSAGVASG